MKKFAIWRWEAKHRDKIIPPELSDKYEKRWIERQSVSQLRTLPRPTTIKSELPPLPVSPINPYTHTYLPKLRNRSSQNLLLTFQI